MRTSSHQPEPLGSLGLLKRNLEVGFCRALLITAGGMQAYIPAHAIHEIDTPKGRAYLYGDFIAIAEKDVDLTLSSENLDRLTIMLTDGTVVHLKTCDPITITIQ